MNYQGSTRTCSVRKEFFPIHEEVRNQNSRRDLAHSEILRWIEIGQQGNVMLRSCQAGGV